MTKSGDREVIMKQLQQIRELAEDCIQKISVLETSVAPTGSKIDFDCNIRAFLKNYSKGISGPRKFALLVAYFSKGEPKTTVGINEIKKIWDANRTMLGGEFRSIYGTRAKENGWLDSSQKGFYRLSKRWQEIFYAKIFKGNH